MSYNFSPIETKLQESADWLKKEYSSISTGRANPSLLDSVLVESYGAMQPIQNIASITVEEARTMRIAPWDKSQIKDIERAIIMAKLPLSLAVDDQGVRASVPIMTEESKKQIVKLAKERLEQSRITVRGIRTDGMEDIKKQEKAGDFAEDDRKRHEEDLQKKIDNANNNLEEIFNKKESDIMSV
ncbi:MAG: ribosome recycling factor [Candidatus Nomurabacteria bacterium]|nr:ribosome recycling factor [Candidatus Nomurabacteria bacterium]